MISSKKAKPPQKRDADPDGHEWDALRQRCTKCGGQFTSTDRYSCRKGMAAIHRIIAKGR